MSTQFPLFSTEQTERQEAVEAVLRLRSACRARQVELPGGRPRSVADLSVLLALLWVARTQVGEEGPETAARVQLVHAQVGSVSFSPGRGLATGVIAAQNLGLDEVSSLLIRRLTSRLGEPASMVEDVRAKITLLWTEIEARKSSFSEEGASIEVELAEVFPPGFSLDRHQSEAVAFLRKANWRGLVADDMGLGKSIVAVAAAAVFDRWPLLVVGPTSMAGTWAETIRRWLASRIDAVLHVDSSIPLPLSFPSRTVVVTTWATLSLRPHVVDGLSPAMIVGDESQALCNPDSIRTRAFSRLAKKAEGCILLSGTPDPNGRSVEFWPQIRLLSPRIPPWKSFCHRFGGGRTVFLAGGKRVTKYDGQSNPVDLAFLLRDVQIRRLKSEFPAGYLPEKTRYSIPVDLALKDRLRLDLAKDEARSTLVSMAHRVEARLLSEGKSTEDIALAVRRVLLAEAVSAYARMRRALGTLKADLSLPLIRDLVEEGRRPVVFAFHLDAARRAVEVYRDAFGVDAVCSGVTTSTSTARHDLVSKWESGAGQVLVVTRKFCTGITVVSGSALVMLERFLLPAEEEQAEDRVHRKGQKNDVGIYYLHSRGTTDDLAADRIDRKSSRTSMAQGSTAIRAWRWLEAEVDLPGSALVSSVGDFEVDIDSFDDDPVFATGSRTC